MQEGGSPVETMRLLFVCTGNTCRSPMAAALAQHLSGEAELPFQVEVRSRGLYAVDGEPMSAHAQEALAERGVTVEHRAAMLEEEDLAWADLVLTMTMQHKRFLWEAFPDYQEKTFTLKEYILELEREQKRKTGKGDGNVSEDGNVSATASSEGEQAGGTGPASENQDGGTASNKADAPEDGTTGLTTGLSAEGDEAEADDFSWEYLQRYFSALDVPDPFGGDLDVYRRTRDDLEASLRRLLDLLATTVGQPTDRI